MKLFHKNKEELEKLTEQKINAFLSHLKSNKKLQDFVKVFGLTGSAGRGQASPLSSDIDFYCITNYWSPFMENVLKNVFRAFFEEIEVETSLLVFSPGILKKPDLMLYEFVNSGKVLYGELDYEIDIKDIPKWEGVRLLTFKGNPFICSDSNSLNTNYSKLLLGIGEAFLLLSGDYVADNFKRYDKVLKNKQVKKIKGFLTEYKKSHKYRYEGYDFKADKKEIKKKGLNFLKKAWRLYLETYFDEEYAKSLKRLKELKPRRLKEKIAGRLFYTFNHLKMFRKLRVCILKEPFIKEVLMIQEYLSNPKKSLKKEICRSWRATPRFWQAK